MVDKLLRREIGSHDLAFTGGWVGVNIPNTTIEIIRKTIKIVMVLLLRHITNNGKSGSSNPKNFRINSNNENDNRVHYINSITCQL